jgi:hypothetical protein
MLGDQSWQVFSVISATTLLLRALRGAVWLRAGCAFFLALLIYQLLSGTLAGHRLWPSATRIQRPLLYWMVIGSEAIVCAWLFVNYLAFA